MAKLVLRREDGGTTEFDLNKDRVTIGRRNDNDICLPNSAVSAEHAVIVTILNDSFLEDLGSTNGTFVNGKPVKRHFLQGDDLIEIGRHRLTFQLNAPVAASNGKETHEAAPTDIGTATSPVPVTPSLGDALPADLDAGQTAAMLLVLNGTRSGQELVLNKDLMSLGKAGVQVVTITKRPHGYFLTHVEGKNTPTVNGKQLETQTYPLYSNDIIELGGVKLQFLSMNPVPGL
jgi:pSer/pThr/pTyr-binding forkhead associated (FHA) protein